MKYKPRGEQGHPTREASALNANCTNGRVVPEPARSLLASWRRAGATCFCNYGLLRHVVCAPKRFTGSSALELCGLVRHSHGFATPPGSIGFRIIFTCAGFPRVSTGYAWSLSNHSLPFTVIFAITE